MIQEDPHKVAGNNSLPPPPPFAPTHTHTQVQRIRREKKKRNQKELKFDQSISKLQDIHKQDFLPFFLNSIIENEKKSLLNYN